MRSLFFVAAIAVLGVATACTVKPDQRPAPDRTPIEMPAPDSWLLNPPNQPAR